MILPKNTALKKLLLKFAQLGLGPLIQGTPLNGSKVDICCLISNKSATLDIFMSKAHKMTNLTIIAFYENETADWKILVVYLGDEGKLS